MPLPTPNFRRLQWKLTLSYTLVTTAAILLIELAALIFAAMLMQRAPLLPTLIVSSLKSGTSPLADALTAQPPDQQRAEQWLAEFVRYGTLTTDHGSLKMHIDPASITQAVVVDAQEHVVAAYPPAACGASLATCLPAEGEHLLARALAGESTPDRLAEQTDHGFLMAVPITQPTGGKVVGALFLRVTLPFTWAQAPKVFLLPVARSALVILLIAAVIGTVFGFLTARSLTHRLKRLATAADAWSQGDFSVLARDTSQDEIGDLARRLNQMASQLENLLHTRQELAAVEERNRLARELHDAVKQQVFAAGMQIAAARRHLPTHPEQAQQALAQAQRLTQQAQQELTALIRELRPAALKDQGLAAALRDALHRWQEQTGIQATLHLQGERRLPLAVEQTLFRIAQEALSNAAKHSQSTRVTLRVVWAADHVTLIVEDNGQGFDPGRARGRGLGLSSMAERAAELGGYVHIHSAPGQGTRIEARLPLPPPAGAKSHPEPGERSALG